MPIAVEGAVRLSKHERESMMDVKTPIFDEYNELAIQYGYIVLFACVFPLGTLWRRRGRGR
jgi:hypothetical protein